jgi:uncharacterized protein (TIGR03435 family)
MRSFSAIVLLLQLAIAQKPSFEVASVKPSRTAETSWMQDCVSGSGARNGISPGTCKVVNASLLRMIALAYDLPFLTAPQYIQGGPNWIRTERFNVEGRAADASVNAADLRLMLQKLLADRFKLKLHEESKEVSGYALTIAKGGPKSVPRPRTATAVACGTSSSQMLAQCLSSRLGEPVVDKTGIGNSPNMFLTMDVLGLSEPNPPSIFTVVEEQLGLKLERQKIRMTMLVIDSADRPDEN